GVLASSSQPPGRATLVRRSYSTMKMTTCLFAMTTLALGPFACSSKVDNGNAANDSSVIDAARARNGAAGQKGFDTGASAGPDENTKKLLASDPPPPVCDGAGQQPGVATTSPMGTLECPSDKNIEGCPCTMGGQTAACWPGL